MNLLNAAFHFVLSTCIFLLIKNGFCATSSSSCSNVGIGIALNDGPPTKNSLGGRRSKQQNLIKRPMKIEGAQILKNSFGEMPNFDRSVRTTAIGSNSGGKKLTSTKQNECCQKLVDKMKPKTKGGMIGSDGGRTKDGKKADYGIKKEADENLAEAELKTKGTGSDRTKTGNKPTPDQNDHEKTSKIRAFVGQIGKSSDQREEKNCIKQRNKQEKYCESGSPPAVGLGLINNKKLWTTRNQKIINTVLNVGDGMPKKEVPKANMPKEEVPKANMPTEKVPKANIPKKEVPKEQQKTISGEKRRQNGWLENVEASDEKRLKMDDDQQRAEEERIKQKNRILEQRRRQQMAPVRRRKTKKRPEEKRRGALEEEEKEKKKEEEREEEGMAASVPYNPLERTAEEGKSYEHTAAAHLNRSKSLGTDVAHRSLTIAHFCNETLSNIGSTTTTTTPAGRRGAKDKQRLLADTIQLGLRNGFCFYVERRKLPFEFELKLNKNNPKLCTINEMDRCDHFNWDNDEENEQKKATNRIVQFHHMLIDTKIEVIRRGANDSVELLFRAPYVFTALRAVYEQPLGITLDDLIRSVAQNPLKLFTNPAQSGATFLRTGDGQFFIKSADREELQFFKTFLHRVGKHQDEINFFVGGIWDYYEYFRNQLLNQKQSLLPKYYALFELVSAKNKEKQSFIMSNNVFPKNFPKIHYKFDLKGSSINRKELKLDSDDPTNKTCRDLDFFHYNSEDRNGTMLEGLFRHGICIERDQHDKLARILEEDTWFLKVHNIMDYSLLLCVHFIENEKLSDKWIYEELPFGVFRGSCSNCKNPKRNVYENDQKLLLSIGIIDTLQTYDYRRELEDFYKSSVSVFKQKDGFLFPPVTRKKYKPNSVKEPSVYRNRFLEAILSIFLRTNDCNNVMHEKGEEYSSEEKSSEEKLAPIKNKQKIEQHQPAAATNDSSPSRNLLDQRKQYTKILKDLKKFDLKIPIKFRKGTPKRRVNEEQKNNQQLGQMPISRALSVPISYRNKSRKEAKMDNENQRHQ